MVFNLDSRYPMPTFSSHKPSESHIIIAALFLSVVTIAFFNNYPQFISEPSELLENPSFEFGLEHWAYSKKGVELYFSDLPNKVNPDDLERRVHGATAVSLTSNDSNSFVSIYQFITPVTPGRLVKLNSTLMTNNVVNGSATWETARVVLLAFDQSDKPRYDRPHVLINLPESSDWAQYERIFEISADTTKLQVAAQLTHCQGQLLVKSFSLNPVELNPQFVQYRLWLLSVWLGFGVWITVKAVRSHISIRSDWFLIFTILGILSGVLMPESLKETLGQSVWPTKSILPIEHAEHLRTFKLSFTIPVIDIYKLGHIVTFTFLPISVWVGNRFRKPKPQQIMQMLVFAICSETLQLFTVGRGPQLGDVFIDSFGILLGLAVTIFCRRPNLI